MKRLLILVLIFVYVSDVYSAPIWEIINPSPIVGDIQSIDFPTVDTGWVLNSAGLIAHTCDRGLNWQLIYLPDSSTGPWYLDAVDGQRVWVLGGFDLVQYGMTRLYFTANGGQNWQMIPLGNIEDPFSASVIYAASLNNVWVGGFGVGQGGTQPVVWRWTDDWERYFLPIRGMPTLNSICVFGNIVWVVGTSGYLVSSSNGGVNWEILNSGTDLSLNAIVFNSPNFGWVGGGNFSTGLIMKTTNAGSSWQRVQTPAMTEVNDLKLFSDSRIIAVTEGGESSTQIIVSNDGQVWNTVLERGMSHLRSISIMEQDIWVGGSDGLILHSNNGMLWNEISRNLIKNATCIQFLDETSGFCVGSDGVLLKTTNGGGFWNRQIVHEGIDLYSVYFLDENNGIVSGTGSIELLTENGGQTWQQIEIGESEISKIRFSGEVGYALNGSSVSISRNRGREWHSVQVAREGVVLTGLSVVDENTAYVCSPYDSVRWTNDYGATWWRLATPFEVCVDIHFINSRCGWAAALEGGNHRIFYTVDGGVNWDALALIRCMVLGIRFADTRNGWLWGANGEFMVTNDGGRTWQNLNLRCNKLIRDIWVYNAQRLWLCGEGGLIARYGENWMSTYHSFGNKTTNSPLISIWPNPSNGFINLNLNYNDLFGKAKLYDIVGRQLAIYPINKNLTGYAYLTIPLFEFPNGNYYLEFETNKGKFINYILLIK